MKTLNYYSLQVHITERKNFKNKTDCRGAVCFVKRVLGLEIKEIIKDNLYSHYTNPIAKIKQFCK